MHVLIRVSLCGNAPMTRKQKLTQNALKGILKIMLMFTLLYLNICMNIPRSNHANFYLFMLHIASRYAYYTDKIKFPWTKAHFNIFFKFKIFARCINFSLLQQGVYCKEHIHVRYLKMKNTILIRSWQFCFVLNTKCNE